MRLVPALFALLARLPLPLNHRIGAALGWLFARLPNPHRRIAETNLALCYPAMTSTERRRLRSRCLLETGKTATESPLLWLGPEAVVRGLVQEVHGAELFEQACAAGKGVLIVGPHMGSWELVSLYISTRMPMTSLYRPLRQASLEGLVVGGRKRFGAELVPTSARGVRALLQALARGEAVGIPPDQDPRDAGGEFAPFFGIPANTMTLLLRLQRKSGAMPLLCVARRLPRGTGFDIHFLPLAEAFFGTDDGAALAALNRGVEQCIALDPAQYQWSYKRFRTRPPGEPTLY